MTICMILVVAVCFGIVCMGLQKGVEKITKKMMILLLALMVILAIRSATFRVQEKESDSICCQTLKRQQNQD